MSRARIPVLLIALFSFSLAHGAGILVPVSETPVGEYGGVAYAQYDGYFEGTSVNGFYRVPYQITAPMEADGGNSAVWVEPSHFAAGLGTLNAYVQRDLALGRGFAFSGIGWGSFGLNLLDRNPGFVVWIAGVKLDDDEDGSVDEDPVDGVDNDADGAVDEDPPVFVDDPAIVAEFGAALAADGEAYRVLGNVKQRYLVGFSQTSLPVRGLVESGMAEGVFDGVLSYVNAAVSTPLQNAIDSGIYGGKVIVLNTEFDTAVFGARLLEDNGSTPDNYRHFAVPGAPHAPDALLPALPQPSSPASYVPQLRAHFWQLHKWVSSKGVVPPTSTRFERDGNDAIARDGSGNALVVDLGGESVPRPPYLELGEATFISGFTGNFVNVRSIGDPAFFASFQRYYQAFRQAAGEYARAGFMLGEDRADLFARASLCSGATYSENYRDRYAQFVAIDPCL
jgi:hypothetical protein